jgi:hypothetical protein
MNAKRGILQRDAGDINKTHLSDADYTADTSLSEVFAQNASCVLSPEETEGPYCMTMLHLDVVTPLLTVLPLRRLWRVYTR